MGTRGAYGFYKNDEDKITYNHFDSYPDALGEEIKAFILNTSIKQMNEIFDRLIMVKANESPSLEEMKVYQNTHDEHVSEGTDWYAVLRGLQMNLQAYRSNPEYKHMIDSKGSMKDSLFCEWAYIINLDKNVLEIYRGFQKTPQNNRYYFEESDNEYYNVALIKEIPFEEMKEFDMKQFEEEVAGV